jgi:hypothetical protein
MPAPILEILAAAGAVGAVVVAGYKILFSALQKANEAHLHDLQLQLAQRDKLVAEHERDRFKVVAKQAIRVSRHMRQLSERAEGAPLSLPPPGEEGEETTGRFEISLREDARYLKHKLGLPMSVEEEIQSYLSDTNETPPGQYSSPGKKGR